MPVDLKPFVGKKIKARCSQGPNLVGVVVQESENIFSIAGHRFLSNGLSSWQGPDTEPNRIMFIIDAFEDDFAWSGIAQSAPNIDLSQFKDGDEVYVEYSGMRRFGTIAKFEGDALKVGIRLSTSITPKWYLDGTSVVNPSIDKIYGPGAYSLKLAPIQEDRKVKDAVDLLRSLSTDQIAQVLSALKENKDQT